MKRVYVGTYKFGFERATLYLREGVAANVQFLPEEGGAVRILIGADERLWQDIVESLIHEVMELTLTKMECSWQPSYFIGNDSAKYKFIATHVQFQEACCRTAEYITPALPVLAKAWAKWNADKKKAKAYVKFKVVCPKCQRPDKKILIEKHGRENHYRCDLCGHDFISWKGANAIKKRMSK